MKKVFFTFFIFLSFLGNNTLAATNLVGETQVSQWMDQSRSLGFQENKGQVADLEGKSTPYVLFKAEAPQLNIWVTTTGLTYQFFKMEQEEYGFYSNSSREGEQKAEEEESGEWQRVDMVLKGATIKKENITTQGDITQGDINYYLGHCPDGVFHVKTYTKITIKEVYPGIDWVLYTSLAGGLKHDFIINPGANPNQVKLIYEGRGKLNTNNNQIHFENELGEVNEGKLFCYQGDYPSSIGKGQEVKSNYIIKENASPLYSGAGNLPNSIPAGSERIVKNLFSCEISISLGNYDNTQPLIIDPQLTWATFYGNNNADGPCSIDCDNDGNVYVGGYTGSFSFPTQPWGSAEYHGTLNAGGYFDAFIVRFTNSGTRVWATYYGGTGADQANSIVCDEAGNVYLAGRTSGSFPTKFLIGAYNQGGYGGGAYDAFISRFDNTGILTWATYYGGSGQDEAYYVTCDETDNIYITGKTNGTTGNFPIQSLTGAYNQGSYGGGGDAFILQFNNANTLTWATYYGGSGFDVGYSIACDVAGNVYVTGKTNASFPPQTWVGGYNQGSYGGGSSDAFILRFDNANTLTWATCYGGSGNDVGYSIACDGTGNIYIAGETTGNFPTQSLTGAYNQAGYGGSGDVFLLRFNNAGALIWSTYYGGSGTETLGSFGSSEAYDNIATDNCGNLYVSFTTQSSNINTFENPGCGNYFDPSYNDGSGDIFIVKFSKTNAVLWATYFGGDGWDYREGIAVDNYGSLFVTGEWAGVLNSNSYPLANPPGTYVNSASSDQSEDGYIAKFSPPATTFSSASSPAGCSCVGTATIVAASICATYSYAWYNSSWTQIGSSPSISSLCGGTYQGIASDSVNCKIDTAFLSISEGLLDGVSGTNIICPGQNTMLSASGGGTYIWSTGETTVSIITSPTITTTYSVIVSNGVCADTAYATITIIQPPIAAINGISIICKGQSIILTAQGGISYTWNTSQTTSIITVSPTTNSTYSVIVSNGACSDVTSISVTVNAIPLIAISGINIICKGTATTLTANQGILYTWSTGATSSVITISPTITTTYSVIVSDGLCQGISLVTVTVIPLPVASINGQTIICPGYNTILTAFGGTTYNWNTGEATPTITISPTTNTTYSVVVYNGFCSDTTSITITMAAPVIAFAGGSSLVCWGQDVILTADGGGTYAWNTGSSADSITVNPITNTTYSVIVSNGFCSDTAKIDIVVNPLPIVTAAPNTNIIKGSSVQLSGNGGGTYSWFPFTGLNCNTCQNPIASPLETTNYCVEVTDANGCTNSACLTITVEILCGEVFVPTALSPNNDGQNDLECLFGNCIQSMVFIIFDRWGEKVFETNDLKACWNGTYKGKPLKAAIFVYYLEAVLLNEQQITKTGNISLIR